MRAVVTLLLAAVPAFAGDSYTITIKAHPDVGKTVRYTSTSTETGSMRGFGGDGKLMFEDKKDGGEESYRSTYLALGKDGSPTRLVRVYEKATETRNGKTTPLSRQGRTFLLERVGTKPRVSVVGEAAIDPKELAKLYKEGDERKPSESLIDHLSPRKPVKVGDSWPIPIGALFDLLDGLPVNFEKSAVTAKLARVYQKGESQFGTVEIRVRVILSGKVDRNGMTATVERPGELTADMTLDVAIDGSSTEHTLRVKSAIKVEALVPMPGGQTGRLVMDVHFTGIDEWSAETDDPKAREVGKVVHLPRPGEWDEFKPEDGLFTADFPGRPTRTSKEGTGYTQRCWMVETKDQSAVYMVRITDHPNPDTADPDAILRLIVNGSKDLRSQEGVEISGVKGVELRFATDIEGKTYEYRQRVAATKHRTVHVIVATQEGKQSDADRFFKSFRMNWAIKPKTVVPAWAEFKPAGGTFVAQFPGTPKGNVTKKEAYSEARWAVETEGGTVSYVVTFTEFANPDQVDPADVLKNVLAHYPAFRGKKDVNVGGVPGIEITYDREFNGVKFVTVERMALTRERGVQLMATAVEGKTAEAAKFFDSFKFAAGTVKKDK